MPRSREGAMRERSGWLYLLGAAAFALALWLGIYAIGLLNATQGAP